MCRREGEFTMMITRIQAATKTRRFQGDTRHHVRVAAIGMLALLYDTEASARAVEVTGCAAGSTTETGARYVLTADVDCAGETEPVLALASGSLLELAGHTLSNGDVYCAGTCRIYGPGTISGGGVIGQDKVLVRRMIITGSPAHGVLATNGMGRARATIVDSVITGNASTGVEADRMTRIIRSRITGNGRHGVAVSLQPFNDCTRGRIRSWRSTVSDNGRDETCGTSEICADVATCARRGPALRASGCDTSYELGSGMPGRNCGVCTFD
jgi:hypothetical protein